MERDTAVQGLGLEHDWARELFTSFGRWLVDKRSNNPILPRLLLAHFLFFERLDAAFSTAEAMQGNALLEHFRTSELRRYLLSVHFLTEAQLVDIDQESKLERAEQDRITDTLAELHSTPCGPILVRYVDWLAQSKTATRTIRLYLSAAATFCKAIGTSEAMPPGEDQLRQYIRRSPGSRANLFRWLKFGCQELGWSVRMPPIQSRIGGRLKAAKGLSILLERIEQFGIESAPVDLLQRAIAKAFSYSPKQLDSPAWDVQREGSTVSLTCSRERIRVPEAMSQIVLEWSNRRLNRGT